MLAPPLEQYYEEVGHDPLWDEKNDDRLLWRGSNTGIGYAAALLALLRRRLTLSHLFRHDRGSKWRESQRIRLALRKHTFTPFARLARD